MIDRCAPDLAALLARRAAAQPDEPAFTFLGNGDAPTSMVTWAVLDERSRTVAAVLSSHTARGDRVLVAYPSGLDFLAAFFGALYAGTIAVPVPVPRSHRQTSAAARFQAIVDDATPAVVLTTTALAASLERLCRERPATHGSGRMPAVLPTDQLERPPSLRRQVQSGSDAPRSLRLRADSGSGPAETGRSDLSAGRDQSAGCSDDIAFLQYTSGSTCAPRGVMVSHANVLHNLRAAVDLCTPGPVEASVSWLPVTHDMGLIEGVLQPLLRGHHAVLLPPAAFLQRPARWLRAIAAYRAARSGAPNFAYDLCARRIRDDEVRGLDLSCWRDAYNGAEPVRHETLTAFASRFRPAGFTPEAFRPCYGLAEATLLVACGRWQHATDGPAACPAVAGDTTVVIIDPVSLARCAPGVVGEIWVAGPGVARGYWGPAAISADVFGARLPGDDRRYLRTGDLGRMDVRGLQVTGRIKDVLIVRGQKHFPSDLEMTAARAHPAAAPFGVAAFAAGASVDGDRIVVAVEVDRRRPERDDAPEAIVNAVRGAVVDNHGIVVDHVVLLPPRALPRTTSGKVQRYLCRDRWREGRLQPEAAMVP